MNSIANDCVELIELSDLQLAEIQGGNVFRTIWTIIESIVTLVDGIEVAQDVWGYIEEAVEESAPLYAAGYMDLYHGG